MTDDGNGSRRGDYRGARIGGGIALIGAVVIIVLIDAFSLGYEADSIIVTTVLGAAAALLGVEILDIVRRKP